MQKVTITFILSSFLFYFSLHYVHIFLYIFLKIYVLFLALVILTNFLLVTSHTFLLLPIF